jgi:hypothetical protein
MAIAPAAPFNPSGVFEGDEHCVARDEEPPLCRAAELETAQPWFHRVPMLSRGFRGIDGKIASTPVLAISVVSVSTTARRERDCHRQFC